MRSKWTARLLLLGTVFTFPFDASNVVWAQTFDEPQFAFAVRTPPGFIATKSIENGVSTWKVRNKKSQSTLNENELVSVTVSALARTPGRDTQEEFRGYVSTFASQILHGGVVEEFRSARFAGHDGFSAVARGRLDIGAGERPAVARIVLMEVEGNHVLASAIALGIGDKAYAEVGTPSGIFSPIESTARPLTKHPDESPHAQQATPTGPLMKAEVGNIDAVLNGPRAPATIILKQPVFIRSVRTYHWNNGRGAPPGMIRLIASDGREVGSWQARGGSGQGGVLNAYWVATVNQIVGSGSYVLQTSNDATWSTNAGVGWRGFYVIEYQRVTQAPEPHQSATDNFEAARAKFDAFIRTREGGDWKAAADAARALVDADPKMPENWRLLARIYAVAPTEQSLDPASAVNALERLVALDPQDAAARMFLAALLIKRNAYLAAVDQIEAAITIKPDLATTAVLNDAAQLYARAELSERGLAFLSNFAGRHPAVQSVALTQALLLKEAGRTAEALLLLRRIVDDPKSSPVDAARARTLMDAWL